MPLAAFFQQFASANRTSARLSFAKYPDLLQCDVGCLFCRRLQRHLLGGMAFSCFHLTLCVHNRVCQSFVIAELAMNRGRFADVRCARRFTWCLSCQSYCLPESLAVAIRNVGECLVEETESRCRIRSTWSPVPTNMQRGFVSDVSHPAG